MHCGSSRDIHEAETSKWCLFRINKLWVRIESVPSWPQLYKYRQVPTEVCRGSCPDFRAGCSWRPPAAPAERREQQSQTDVEEQRCSCETVPIPFTFSHDKWGSEDVKATHLARGGLQAPRLDDSWRRLLRFLRHWAVQSERRAALHGPMPLLPAASPRLPELLCVGPCVRVIATEKLGAVGKGKKPEENEKQGMTGSKTGGKN